MSNLRYIGSGAYRPDMPARDLDAAEIVVFAERRGIEPDEFVAEALSSGLYAGDSETVDAFSVAPTKRRPTSDEPKTIEEMGRDKLRAACADLGLGQGGSKVVLLERIRAKLAETEPTPDMVPDSAPETPEAPVA